MNDPALPPSPIITQCLIQSFAPFIATAYEGIITQSQQMASKKKVDLTTVIRDADHFLGYFNEKNPKLLIIDVHPSWSGPCQALTPFYKNLQTNVIDEFQKRVDIVLLAQEKVESLGIAELHSTCKPKIIVALQGKIIFTANGPNATELEEHVKKNVPYI